MGGGDLNLKKSWHPSTLRNIERVWKAEQKHEVEQQKIEQLQKELAEERAREEIQTFAEDQGVVRKKDERLDWMYQGPASMVNRDEYLLGRKIDKTLETLTQIEKGGEPEKEEGVGIVNNSMFNRDNLAGSATVDLATKIREDPLFSIMKKEKEERKNLLTNPVKMKQLQEMLKASLGKSKSKKNKKNKKKKHQDSDSDEEKQKIRQKKHQDSGSSEETKYKKHKKHQDSDSDEEKQNIRQKKHQDSGSSEETKYKKHKKHQDSDSDEEIQYKRQKKHQDNDIAVEKQYRRQKKHKTSYSSESEEDQTNHQSKKGKTSNGDYSSSDKRNSKYKNDVPDYDKRKYKTSHIPLSNKEDNYHSRSNSDPKESRHESYQERTYATDHQSSKKKSSKYEFDEPKSDKRHKNSHVSSSSRESGHHSSHSKKSRAPSYIESPPHRTENGYQSHYSRPYKSKPPQENDRAADKKKKLDASERERLLKEMQENAKWREDQRKRNTQRYKEEEEREKEMTVEKIKSDAFLKPLLSKAAGKGSLENRLKQKIFSIQRSSSAMDKNFARRD